MGPPGRLTAIFVPPTSTSWEQEARPIPAATGHWMVGEFGSSSPDWWMACLTLSEQDGRCAGCSPQIVTFDRFIRGWFIELSSPWNEVPRRFSCPRLSCLSHTHPGTVVRLAGPRTASPNQGQTRQQGRTVNIRKLLWNDAASRWVPSLSWLWWTVGEPEERPSAPGPLAHPDVYLDKAAFMQLSGGEVIQGLSAKHKGAAGVHFNLPLWI